MPWENAAVIDPFSTVTIILEIGFLAVLAGFAWKQRGNRFVFWGLIAVMVAFAAIYVYKFSDIPPLYTTTSY
jgi:hypothetical protein